MQSQYYGFTEGEKMQRILLKLSGEALAGEKKQGFDEDTVRAVALQVKQLVDDGIQVGIVIGGGNFWRGRTSEHIDRTKADQIGMLATVMNCIYVSEIFRRKRNGRIFCRWYGTSVFFHRYRRCAARN